jgi:carbonic anhydrase/acetyltransferase-like protein (isoleucine patch superfamily)
MIVRFDGTSPTIADDVFIAPTAAVIGDTEIGKSSNVWFGAVVRGDYGPIRIGAGCSIQDNAVIHVNHDSSGRIFPTTIEDDCIVGHGAVLEGCWIGRGCLIGMNAVILPQSKLGAGTIVAAGSVVRQGADIPPYSLLAGAPAIVKRTFDGPGQDHDWAINEYRALSAKYRTSSETIS